MNELEAQEHPLTFYAYWRKTSDRQRGSGQPRAIGRILAH